MYALFEDSGKFLAGRLMSEAESGVQVELDSGKRVKVKNAHVLLRFAAPAPAEFLAQAQALAQDIDLDLAWGDYQGRHPNGHAITRRSYSFLPTKLRMRLRPTQITAIMLLAIA